MLTSMALTGVATLQGPLAMGLLSGAPARAVRVCKRKTLDYVHDLGYAGFHLQVLVAGLHQRQFWCMQGVGGIVRCILWHR
jgi:hypothetical protein